MRTLYTWTHAIQRQKQYGVITGARATEKGFQWQHMGGHKATDCHMCIETWLLFSFQITHRAEFLNGGLLIYKIRVFFSGIQENNGKQGRKIKRSGEHGMHFLFIFFFSESHHLYHVTFIFCPTARFCFRFSDGENTQYTKLMLQVAPCQGTSGLDSPVG